MPVRHDIAAAAIVFVLAPLSGALAQSNDAAQISGPETKAAADQIVSDTDCDMGQVLQRRQPADGSSTIVFVTVGIDGVPKDVRVESSSGDPILDEVAARCVILKWKFRPAMENGKPVEGSKEYRIRWKMTN